MVFCNFFTHYIFILIYLINSIPKIYLIYKYVYLKLKGISLLSPRKMKFKTRGIRGKLSLFFFGTKKPNKREAVSFPFYVDKSGLFSINHLWNYLLS